MQPVLHNYQIRNTKYKNTKYKNTKYKNTKYKNTKYKNTKEEKTKIQILRNIDRDFSSALLAKLPSQYIEPLCTLHAQNVHYTLVLVEKLAIQSAASGKAGK